MSGSAFVLGLTGSIGTGKTTTSAMFAEAGAWVWSADNAVERLYAPGGGAENAVGKLCPDAVPVAGGGVNKSVLKSKLTEEPKLLERLEDAVHPLVAREREDFICFANANGAELIVLEIPLLFETDSGDRFDAIAVVSVPADEQRRRAMKRGTMSERQFEALSSRQIPDGEKRSWADFVVDATSPEKARQTVRAILQHVKERKWQRKS